MLTELKYKGLAFEGGGILGIGHVGAIKRLEELELMDDFTHFAGTSAGAIVAGLCACKADSEFLLKAIDIDYESLLDDDFGIIRDLNRLWSKFGYYKGNRLEHLYGQFLETLTGDANITFSEIKDKYGSFLVIPTTEIFKTTCLSVYMNPDSHPDMMLKTAVRMSASYPFIYAPKKYMSDGGILDNYPIKSLYKYIDSEQVLGIKFIGNHNNEYNDRPENMIECAKSITKALRSQAMKMHVDKADWNRTIKIEHKNLKSMDFGLTGFEKEYLFSSGINAVNTYFN
jgi:NTE family protein